MLSDINNIFYILGFDSTLGHLKPTVNNEVQKEAVEKLIHRLIPGRSLEFTINIDPSLAPPDKDYFKVSTNIMVKVNIKIPHILHIHWTKNVCVKNF